MFKSLGFGFSGSFDPPGLGHPERRVRLRSFREVLEQVDIWVG